MRKFIDSVTAVIVFLTALVSSFSQGLFFDNDFYVWQIIIQVTFIAYISIQWFHYKEFNRLVLVMFSIPLMYIFSLFNSLSFYSTIEEVMRWSTYSSFFGILLLLMRNKNIRDLLPIALIGLLSIIVIFPYAVKWEIIDYQDALWADRMSGVFQYANTFGVMAAAGWLFTLVWGLTTYNLYTKNVCSIFTVVFLGSVLYSQSRGVMLLLPMVWLLTVLILDLKSKIRFIGYSMLSTLLALLLYKLDGSVWVVLLTSLTYVGSKVLYDSLTDNIVNSNKVKRIVDTTMIGGSVYVLCDILLNGVIFNLLPSSLQTRLSDISLTTSSVAGRLNFAELSLDMSTISPLFGNGGDSWNMLFTRYQDKPFWSTDPHSFLSTFLLDIGWIGISIVITLLLTYVFFFVKNELSDPQMDYLKIGAFTSTLLILVHSAIDFNLSMGTAVFILLMFLAVTINEQKFEYKRPKIISYISILLIVLLSLNFSVRSYAAEFQVRDVTSDMDMSVAEKRYLKATKYNPWQPKYTIELASLYTNVYKDNKSKKIRERALELIGKAYESVSNSRQQVYELGQLSSDLNEDLESIRYLKRAYELDQFSNEISSALINQQVVVGELNNKRRLLQEAIALYETQTSYAQRFEGMEIADKRPVKLEEMTYLFASEAYFILKQDDLARETIRQFNLKGAVQKPEVYNRAISLLALLGVEEGQILEEKASNKEIYKDYKTYFNQLRGL